MRKLYGVTNHNIAFVSGIISAYRKKKQPNLKVQFLGFDSNELDKKADVVLIPTSFTLQRHLKELNKSKAVVFVFDTAVQVFMLKPVEMLDVESVHDNFRFVYKHLDSRAIVSALQDGLSAKSGLEIKKETVDMIPSLLHKVHGSIIGPIMSFTYKIPNTDDREKVLGLVLTWLVGTQTTDALIELLKKEYKFKKVSKALQEMVVFFNSDVGKQGRLAVQFIVSRKTSSKQINYKAISKKFKIDQFDLKYALQLFRRNKTFRVMNASLKQLFVDRKLSKAASSVSDE